MERQAADLRPKILAKGVDHPLGSLMEINFQIKRHKRKSMVSIRLHSKT